LKIRALIAVISGKRLGIDASAAERSTQQFAREQRIAFGRFLKDLIEFWR